MAPDQIDHRRPVGQDGRREVSRRRRAKIAVDQCARLTIGDCRRLLKLSWEPCMYWHDESGKVHETRDDDHMAPQLILGAFLMSAFSGMVWILLAGH
jgi:hypothetical protein